MECILVRHGIAVERDEWEGAEENRPLTERGKNVCDKPRQGWPLSTVDRLTCLRVHSFGRTIRRGVYGWVSAQA
jgi:hypothetical protein